MTSMKDIANIYKNKMVVTWTPDHKHKVKH